MDGGQHPPASDNKGPALLASVCTLHVVAVVIFVVRLVSRLTPKYALTVTDYMISISLASKCVTAGLTIAAVANGFGKHAVYLAASSVGKIGLYAFLTFIFSTISTGFARISIACLLLQVATARRWRLALWTTIVLQALVMIVYCVVQLAQCHSAISRKIDIKQTQCLTPSQVWSFTYVSISIAMFSDLVCALIPIFLIRSLTRSLVEKMLISLLLASCLIASGIGIAKLYCMSQFDFSSTDGLYLMVDMFIWSRAEESAIVIAACAPLLKVPVEKALRRLGVRGFSIPEPELNSIVTTMPDTGESKGSSRLEWGTDSQRSKTSGAPSSVQS